MVTVTRRGKVVARFNSVAEREVGSRAVDVGDQSKIKKFPIE